MTTVASRTFRSNPHRDTVQTWHAITELLIRGKSGAAKAQLLAVAGVAASIIAEQTPKGFPIVVTCEGPRTRIYCTYDDDAIDGTGANEDALGFDPLSGDWRMSLPCPKDDLAWVQAALKKHSDRITARGPDDAVAADQGATTAESLVVDIKGFLGS
jgi:hypothetical protein